MQIIYNLFYCHAYTLHSRFSSAILRILFQSQQLAIARVELGVVTFDVQRLSGSSYL